MGSTGWSVSCFLFIYSQCPQCYLWNKGGTCPMESASLFPIEHKRRRRLKAKMHRQGVLHYISNSMLNILIFMSRWNDMTWRWCYRWSCHHASNISNRRACRREPKRHSPGKAVFLHNFMRKHQAEGRWPHGRTSLLPALLCSDVPYAKYRLMTATAREACRSRTYEDERFVGHLPARNSDNRTVRVLYRIFG